MARVPPASTSARPQIYESTRRRRHKISYLTLRPPIVLRNGAWVYEGPHKSRKLRADADILLVGGRVAAVGNRVSAPVEARVIDASRWLVLPGFVNAHHHLSQQLTRTRACDGGLVEWLADLYPVWNAVDQEIAYHSARVGIAELVLTGTTTISDFTYFFPRGQAAIFDAQVAAANELGCRFVPVRGGIVELEAGVRTALGPSFEKELEDPDTFLSEADRVIDAYHDPSDDALCRVAVGLTEKAYGSPRLMTEIAELAERREVRLHTHLHPRVDERMFVEAELGVDPIGFLESVGWWGDRLWVAHGTRLRPGELDRMASARVGLCTCPSSNARFGTPIAPAFELHREGGHVGIGVDGAASNDGGDMLGECRLTLQAQRIRAAADGLPFGEVTPSLVLDWATMGGADLLGWPALGTLVEGGLADLACFDLATLDYAGASDPLAALLLCGISHRAACVIVGGQIVVEEGRLVRCDEEEIAAAARQAEQELCRRTGKHAREALTRNVTWRAVS